PQPGWVEHDADEIWSTSLACARDALAGARIGADELAAIGITNQRETAVVWERATGRPIHRAIVGPDRRTAARMDELRAAGRGDEVAALTGLRLDPYFSASKFEWILDHVDGARARAERGELACGTVDAWLAWNLTRGAAHVTDASNASRTMLARLVPGEGCAWDDRLCGLFGVPRAMLPRIVDSSGVVAHAAKEVLGAAVPIAGIAGDQQAALFGQRCLQEGEAKCTFGTGCFLLANAGETRPATPEGLLATIAWRIGGKAVFAVEGSVFVGGSAVQWLRDGLCIITSARQVNDVAAEVADGGGVVVVPAFTGLGAPWWDADARGAVLGLTRGSTRAHVARATLEGVAHQVADLVEAIEAGGVHIARLRVDGGAAASDLLMQIEADLAGRVVERPVVLETTALGAAMLAAQGVVGAADASRAAPQIDRVFTPALEGARRDAQRARWRHAVATVRLFGGGAPRTAAPQEHA
ncbi:MAG: FGGY family carbohydrate kinase, partial [Phycisphaerales bacterium]